MQTPDSREQAILWRIRLADPAAKADAWAAFTDWLEADPANAEAYDAVALADAKLSEDLALAPAPRLAAASQPGRWRPALWWAMAASLALVALFLPRLWRSEAATMIQTLPGERREVSLADGSLIVLNGGTQLRMDRHERRVQMDAGEALFRIRHDASNPFVVIAGADTLKDVGTEFNVRLAGTALDVSVAEGAVAYNPQRESLMVQAGQHLSRAGPQSQPVVTPQERATFAAWQQGRLVYSNALLADVALDLSRSLGVRISLAPELVARRFTGTLLLDGDQLLLFRRLESLLGVQARRGETGWTLSP